MRIVDNNASSSDILSDLPDRAALDQLCRALWSRGTLRGAAVLVGAGVSRGGARLLADDVPPPPLWPDLADAMARELYGTQSPQAPKDPLRLAEEFRMGLGDAALAEFLRRQIRDDAYEPGSIHRELLDLPWADILTTNYDTLLERAAKDARRGYDIVHSEKDLPHAGRARIIKLHGSLRDGADVVLSEEDYRTYPERRAAFVNTARQVFIENELCLLGFSGDDPNFLQWAGWVRDRFSGHARRIYLVGALDLPPVKRRLLEAHGIAPIDLAPAVRGERPECRRSLAISLFLSHLKAARPTEAYDWRATSYAEYPSFFGGDHEAWVRDRQNPDKVVEAFRKVLKIWQQDRKSCPDWVVCPNAVRLSIRSGTNAPDNVQLALDTLPESEQREALLEMGWRYDQGGQPLPAWLSERMAAIATPEILAEANSQLVRALARVLLGDARLLNDDAAFAVRLELFKSITGHADLPAIVAHERCLLARDQLDFGFVEENAKEIDGDDPVWGLRRAALLYWVGEVEEAQQTLGRAVRELRTRVLNGPDSIALRSRLAWAKIMAQALRWDDDGALLTELDGLEWLALRNYNPEELLQALNAEIGEQLRKRMEARQIEPRFEAGAFIDNRNTFTISSAPQFTLLYELNFIADRVGLPVRMQKVNVVGTSLADAMRLAFEPTVAWHSALLSTKPDYSKGPINIHLGRISVARLNADVAKELGGRLELAVHYWFSRLRRGTGNWDDVDALRLYVEALSRVATRSHAGTAKQYVRLAVDLACDEAVKHWQLNEPIGNLLKRSVEAVPPRERGELSPELLRFPMAAERDDGGPVRSWYDPAPDTYRFVRRSGHEAVFDDRVAKFLQHLSIDNLSRPEAAARLLSLFENGQLTEDQTTAFAKALWNDTPEESAQLPKALHFLKFAFVIAPTPPNIDSSSRVYAHLFGPDAQAEPIELVMACKGQTIYIKPNEEDALLLFRKVTDWRPEHVEPGTLGDALSRPARQQKNRMMAAVLGIVAAPALAKKDITDELAEAALKFLRETQLFESLSALPMFYGINENIDRRIENSFFHPLSIGDRDATPCAVDAIDRWLCLSETSQAPVLPDVLRDRVLKALERGRIGGLSHLIFLTRRLVEMDLCGDSEIDRVTDVLGEFRDSMEYGPPDGDVDTETDRIVSLPQIRAQCVRLAQALQEKGIRSETIRVWLDLARSDPLPEVRHAINGFTED